MEDILKSIKAFLYDRTISPLFGAYMMSTLVWNYRVVVAVFDGDATLTDKFTFIDNYFGVVNYYLFGYSFQAWGQVIHGFLGPTLLTLIYLFIYPRLAKPVYEHSLAKQKELKDVKQRIEDSRLLTVEESRKLMKEIEQIRYKADEEAQQYRTRIASLTETINGLEASQKSAPRSLVEDAKNKVNKPKLDFKALENEARNRIKVLPNSDYQLSDLIDSTHWNNLDETNKQKLINNFKKLVESGDVAGVTLSNNTVGNQILFRKGSADLSPRMLNFKSSLENLIPKEKFDSEEQRLDLLGKFSSYCINNGISLDMTEILVRLVLNGGMMDKKEIQRIVGSKLSQIELDHMLNELENQGIVDVDSVYGIELTDEGKAMVVESGLAKIGKILSQKSVKQSTKK